MRRHAVELLLFSMVFLSGSYFYNGAVANQIARYDTIFSFVEPGTPDHLSFRINRFVRPPGGEEANTIDWANNPAHDDNYYSNKAPGIAYLGIPVYFAIHAVETAFGWDPRTHGLTYLNCYLLNVVLTVVPLALSAPAFYRTLRLVGGPGPWVFLVTIGLYFGTLLFPYATQLWGHATAAACVVLGLYAFLRGTPRSYAWSGFILGLGVLVEYAVAITLASLVAVLIVRRRARALGALVLGGLLPLAAFLWYHERCFGAPLTIANLHTNPEFVDEGAVGGLFALQHVVAALRGLTVSPYRGLFWHMPVLLLAVPAVLAGGRLRDEPVYWICVANILGFLLMNVTFTRWDGGACVGPRYQIPALPFYVLLIHLGMIELRKRRTAGAGRWARRGPAALGMAFAALLTISISHMLVTVSVSPLASEILPWHTPAERETWRHPLKLYYEKFVAGELQPHGLVRIRLGEEPWGPAVRRYETFILGTFVGLRGAWVTLPVVVLLLAGLAAGVMLAWRAEPRA